MRCLILAFIVPSLVAPAGARADGAPDPAATEAAQPACDPSPTSFAQVRPARPPAAAGRGRLIVAGSQDGCARIDDPAAALVGPIGVEITPKQHERRDEKGDPSLTIAPQVD